MVDSNAVNPFERFSKDDRTIVYIDGSNLYGATRLLGFDIDYSKFLNLFKENCKLVRVNYYTAIPDSSIASKLRPVLDWMSYNGYHIVSKPTKELIDERGRSRLKGNVDVDIAVGMLSACSHIEHAVLVSGDGDFRVLVEAVQARGVKVTVISTLKSSPPVIADELRRQADDYIDLNDLKEYVCKTYS